MTSRAPRTPFRSHRRRSRAGRALALALVAALVLAACGDDADEAAPDDDAVTTEQEAPAAGESQREEPDGDFVDLPEACLLLDPDEVEQALGSPADPELTEDLTGETVTAYSFCRWQADDGRQADLSIIDNTTRYEARRDLADEEFWNDVEDLDEPGEESFVGHAEDESGATALNFHTLHEGWTIEVNIGHPPGDDPPSTDAAAGLVRAVLDRL